MLRGCSGYSCLKINKLPNFHFIFFDRYRSQIHDFQDLFTGIFIIFQCPSFPEVMNNEMPYISKTKNLHVHSKILGFAVSQIYKHNTFQTGFHVSCIV